MNDKKITAEKLLALGLKEEKTNFGTYYYLHSDAGYGYTLKIDLSGNIAFDPHFSSFADAELTNADMDTVLKSISLFNAYKKAHKTICDLALDV